MADHSQKWHDRSSSKNIESSSNSEGIAAIVNKLENLGRDMKKLKENVHAIQVGCQNFRGAHLDKDCPLKEEVKASRRLNLANLGANVNVIPKSIFEHLKLARLKKTDMLVEMADLTKRSLIGVVENIIVKINKFLFPSNFVVMNMLNTCNETMIIGRPFLATVHAEIDVFNKEISLGIGSDRVTFDMDKKIHNFTNPIGEIYMINATSNTPSDASSRVEETNDVHNKSNSCNQEQ
ncbi:putative reverse transcriptase domain-containing protein [Tanacetum coccineum]